MRHRFLRVLAILTVGLPFCVFKILTGSLLMKSPAGQIAGVGLIALGAVDLLLNVVGLIPKLEGRLGVCALEHMFLKAKPESTAWREFGLSLDVALSFGLVAMVVALNLVGLLGPIEYLLWSTSVVLNVMGAGIGRITESFHALTVK